MKLYTKPNIEVQKQLLERSTKRDAKVFQFVEMLFQEMEEEGEACLKKYCLQLDGYYSDNLLVSPKEIRKAKSKVDKTFKISIELAKENIEKFHCAQKTNEKRITTSLGTECWQESRGIENIGIYVPGGSAPLCSTVLMLGIPAIIAACANIYLFTPPNSKGEIDPHILYTANLLGIENIYKLGGAQAIAAMSLGNTQIPKVDKIFGPGNQYVNYAKMMACNYNTAIDLPAGPSEVLIIADERANSAYIAADLLAQAEHDPLSQVVFLSNSTSQIKKVLEQVMLKKNLLKRKKIIQKALENSFAIYFESIAKCIEFSNAYAPEHLSLNFKNAEESIHKIKNAGSVFIGPYSPIAAGDYASGTNHTLPTAGNAKSYSGLNLDSFQTKISFQKVSQMGLKNLRESIECLASIEGLDGHKESISIRFN